MFLIQGNFSDSNTGDGLYPSNDGVLTTSNTSSNNGGDGIVDSDYGCTMVGNVSFNNTGDGIVIYYLSTYYGNYSYYNGDDGMEFNSDANYVWGNVLAYNGANGINTDTESENLIQGNYAVGNVGFDLFELGATETNWWDGNIYNTKNF